MIIHQLRRLAPRRPVTTIEATSIAERQAAMLRRLLILDRPAVSLGSLKKIPDLIIESVPGLPVSGATHKIGRSWVVLINADEAPTRQRFTVGHELKHIIDHPIAAFHATDSQWIEWICDYFSACLLIPRPLLKRIWTTTTQKPDEIAAIFGVSEKAARFRLDQVGLVDECCTLERSVIPQGARVPA